MNSYCIKAITDELNQMLTHFKEENEHEQLKIIKASLTKLIRRWCDTKPIVFVSEKAEKRADELGVDLFEIINIDQYEIAKNSNGKAKLIPIVLASIPLLRL